MSNIVACYKWVIDEAYVRVKDDLSIDFSMAQMKISDYDRNTIASGVELASILDGKCIGVTYGGEKAKKSAKEALARGLDELIVVEAPDAEAFDSASTADALSRAINTIDDVALVMTSEGASDDFSRQTAPRIATKLGWPVVTCACEISFSGKTASIRRQLESSYETVEVELPAVVSVVPAIATPTIPGLKQIMAAKKKPNSTISAESLGAKEVCPGFSQELKGYSVERKNIVFDGASNEAISEFVTALRKEGVL